MAPPSPPSGAMEQQLRNQHCAPSSGYLGSASPGQFLPSLQSIYLNGAQVQQQQPPLFPGSEMASPIRFRPSLPSPSYHAADHACGVPMQPHPSPSGFQDALHAQVPLPSRPQVMSRGDHEYLSQGDCGALELRSGSQGTLNGQFQHPFLAGNPNPSPCYYSANDACGVPLQHPSPPGFQEAHHAQVSCPSRPQVMSHGNHEYLCQGDRGALYSSGRLGTFPGQFSHPFYGGDPGLLPSSPNSGRAGFSAGGTGHEAHTLPSSNPSHGEVGGGGYVCEGEESWKLHGNQHSVGTSSQASSIGDGLARGWDSLFGCLRYGGCGKTDWMEKEQEILEDKVLE